MNKDEHFTEFVTFTIAGQLFGLPIAQVQDVFKPMNVTRVPLAGAEIAGVLNLRGKIVTALDIRARLGLPTRPQGTQVMAVGVESAGESYGLIVDEVGDVLTLDPLNFEPLPDTLDERWRSVSKSVYHLQDNLVVVFDVDRLLNIDGTSRP